MSEFKGLTQSNQVRTSNVLFVLFQEFLSCCFRRSRLLLLLKIGNICNIESWIIRKGKPTGTPAGKNLSNDASGIMKQSRSKVAREIGSPRGGLLPDTTRGV